MTIPNEVKASKDKAAPTQYLDAAALLDIETAVNRYPLCGIQMECV